MMGLLRLSGVNVGKEERFVGAGAMNPKGFFELHSHEKFLQKVYKGIYPIYDVQKIPDIKMLQYLGKKHYLEYRELIKAEFGGNFPIAIKANSFFTLPFLHELKKEFDIKILVMERNEEDQINSMVRVWEYLNDPVTKPLCSKEFVTKLIKAEKRFCEKVQKHYDFKYFHVSFEKLINNPVQLMKEISDFTDIPCARKQVIKKFIDKTLVNRKTLSIPQAKTPTLTKIIRRIKNI